MNIKKRLLAAALASLAFAPTLVADDAVKVKEKDKDAPIVVPIEILPSRHFVVQVKLNDKGPYRFILDTGAPITIINNKTAKDSELTKKSSGGGLLGMFGGGLNQMDVPKMDIGGVVAEKTTAMVMDHPTVQAISEAFKKDSGPVEGLIGFPFFARFSMTVDYQKKELTFRKNGYKPGDYMADLTNSLMNLEEKNKPRVVASAGLWGFGVDKAKDDEEAGVEVKEVYEKSPAAEAGLKVGDRLLTVDGRWTDSPGDTALAASLVKPGRKADLTVKRDGKEVKLVITPVMGR